MTDRELNKNIETFKNRIKDNQAKYGKNFPWKAWLPKNVLNYAYVSDDGKMSGVLCQGNPKTVFSGRFCAVSGFIYAIVNGKYSVLANLRGPGTPDYQNHWNAVCGFLECFENSRQGIQREVFEECGFYIDENDLNVIHVETEPEECNNGNVTIRHTAFLGKIIPTYTKAEGGEENEVDSVKWIPIDDLDDYKWAFNHRKVIELYAPKKWKRKLIEFFYKYFNGYNMKYTDEDTLMYNESIGM